MLSVTNSYAHFIERMVLSGPCYNAKTVVLGIDFHGKDKTVARPSYLYQGDPYNDKPASLSLRRPQVWKQAQYITLKYHITVVFQAVILWH